VNSPISGSPSLFFEYLSTSLLEGMSSIPLIHLESIDLPSPAIYRLVIRQIGGRN
jgi:hypothetical protein